MGATDQSMPLAKKQPSESDIAFRALFPEITKTLMQDANSSFSLPATASAYIQRNVTYNVPHGKLNRGLAVYQCYAAFNKGLDRPPLTEQEQKNANILGWCIELLQAFFLVSDDIMDDSVTRRGQPCFYRIPEIGLKAINDALILEAMIYRLLRVHFRDHPAYLHIMELFQDITYTTEIGQMLDLTSQDDGPVQLDRFTDEALARIYRYKTSHYSFYLPVALGMRLAGVDDPALYETARTILLEMGHYFQAQDDYLDAFGDPQVTGKIGTDIEENTCTWLVVEALKVIDEEGRNILEQNYGKKSTENSDKVKDLYRKLGIPEKFKQFEEESYTKLRKMIHDVDNMPTGAFEFLLAKIFKRTS